MQIAEKNIETEEKSELQELQDQVTHLTEQLQLVLKAAGMVPSEEGEDQRKSKVERLLAAMVEGYTPEQVEKAEQWVIKEIGGRLKVVDGVAGKQEIICKQYTVTQAHRDAGITSLSDGFKVTHSVPVHVIAAYYISIILDEKSSLTDSERIIAMIDDSRKRGSGKDKALHPELEHLLLSDGSLREKGRARRPNTKRKRLK